MTVVRDDVPEPEEVAPTEVLPPQPEPGSALAFARERNQALRAENTKVFTIPGYRGRIGARYHPVEYKRTQEIRRGALQRVTQKGLRDWAELYARIDALASGCEAVVIKAPNHPDADEDGWVGIEYDVGWTGDTDGPVLFDQRLAEAMGFGDRTNGGRARMVVLNLFPSEGAIEDHFAVVQAWMDNPFIDEAYDEDADGEEEADEPAGERELAGESEGSAP